MWTGSVVCPMMARQRAEASSTPTQSMIRKLG